MVLHPACHDGPVEFYNLHGFIRTISEGSRNADRRAAGGSAAYCSLSSAGRGRESLRKPAVFYGFMRTGEIVTYRPEMSFAAPVLGGKHHVENLRAPLVAAIFASDWNSTYKKASILGCCQPSRSTVPTAGNCVTARGVVCGDHSKALQPRHKRPSVGTAARNSLTHDKTMLATSCGFSTAEK